MRLYPLVLALTAASPALVAAQPAAPARPRVAVVVDLVANVSPERATALASALSDALQRELEVDTIGGPDAERRLPPGGVPEDCVAAPACITDLGARLDAGQVLFLSMVAVGGTVRVDATWVDVASGEAVSRPRVEVVDDAKAGDVFAAAAPRLLPDAPKRPPEGVDGRPRPPGPRRHMTVTTWAIAGASVAALAGGVGFGLAANGTYGRCERDPDSCDGDTRDGIASRALIADVLFAGALIGATATTILYLRSADRREAAPPAKTLTVSPVQGGAFAELRVRF